MKFFNYFLTKYSYTRDDLVSCYGEEFNTFFNLMKSKNLVDPKENKLSLMEKEIDTFMDEMIYSNRRRRRG